MQKHKLLGTNKDGSSPKRTRKSGSQVDHLGRPTPNKGDRTRADFIMGKSAEPGVSHRSHNLAAHSRHGQPGNIARDGGKPKHTYDVRPAAGMHRVTGTNEGAPVITTLQSIPDASNPNYLDPTKQGKRLSPAAVHPSMKSGAVDSHGSLGSEHNPQVGDQVLSEGLRHAGPDHPALHGNNVIIKRGR